MKQRLLVMNGQRLVQHEQEGKWNTDKVDKAGLLKPGIYNIYLASEADKSQVHVGVIIHADKLYVYQQVGKLFVAHQRSDFDQVGVMGAHCSIKYERGRAVVSAWSNKLGRTRSR